MKKTFSLLLCAFTLLLSFSLAVSAGSAAVESIEAVQTLTSPKIDGTADKLWDNAKFVDVVKFGSNIYKNTSTPEAHAKNPVASAKVKLMWDETHLYVLGIVTDPTPNTKATKNGDEHIDGMDVQISENNAPSGKMRDDTVGSGNTLPANGNFNININGKATGWGGVWFANNGSSKVVSAAKQTDTGYIIEAALPLQTIKGSVGTKIGIEFQINDNQTGEGRTAIRQWSCETCSAHSEAKHLGTCTFVAAPVQKAPATFDMGLTAAVSAALALAGFTAAKKRK